MEMEILSILQEINPYEDIEIGSRLLEEDIIDSVGILVLITELEEKYNIIIPLDKISSEDFASIKTIINLIERLRKE